MTQLQEDWAEQYRSELEKQSSARAAQIESLLFAGDYEAIREWLDQWEQEDKDPDSLRQQYRKVRSQLRKAHDNSDRLEPRASQLRNG
jgi:exonuclease III